MAVTFDTYIGNAGRATNLTASLNHAADVVIFIGIAYAGTTSPSSVTVGGVAAELVPGSKYSQGSNASVEVRCIRRASAANETVSVSFAATTVFGFDAISFTGANASVETLNGATGSGASVQSALVAISAGTTGRIAVQFTAGEDNANGSGALAFAPGNSETETGEYNYAGASSRAAGGIQGQRHVSSVGRNMTCTITKAGRTINWATVTFGVRDPVSLSTTAHAYIEGAAPSYPASSNTPAYIMGISTLQTAIQSAFIAGGLVPTPTFKPAYIMGISTPQIAIQSAYIRGGVFARTESPKYTEDFEGVAGALSDPPWTSHYDFKQVCRDGNGHGITNGGDESVSGYTAASFPPDQYSQVTLVSDVTFSPCVRMTLGDGGTCYWANFSTSDTGTLTFGWYDGSTWNNLSTQTNLGSTAVQNGDTIRLEVRGWTLTYFVNGVQLANSYTDESHLVAAGVPGLDAWSTQVFDNWEGGGLTGGGQSAFIQGAAPQNLVSTSKPAYLKGQAYGQTNQPAYLKGVATGLSVLHAYLAGQLQDQTTKPAYIRGQAFGVDSHSGYIRGSAQLQTNQAAFIQGQASDLTSTPAYIVGGIKVSATLHAYIEGYVEGIPASTSLHAFMSSVGYEAAAQHAFICGGLPVSASTPSFIRGVAHEITQLPSYIHGSDFADTGQHAFIHGKFSIFSEISAFIAGGLVQSTGQAAYIHGKGEAVSQLSAFIVGFSANLTTTPAYIRGQAHVGSSIPAYLAGGIQVSTSCHAFISGIGHTASQLSAFIEGREGGSTTRQHAYITGSDTGITFVHSYIDGGLKVQTSLHAFIQGVSHASTSVSAFVTGQALVTNSQKAYIAGRDVRETTLNAYIHGSDRAFLVQNAYVRGQDLAFTVTPAYIFGAEQAYTTLHAMIVVEGFETLTSQSAYIEGIVRTSQSAYIEGYEPWNFMDKEVSMKRVIENDVEVHLTVDKDVEIKRFVDKTVTLKRTIDLTVNFNSVIEKEVNT